MIIVAWNDVLNGIDLMVDAAGVDLLIERLTTLKNSTSRSHMHIDDVGTTSPWGHTRIARGIVIDWIGEPDLFGEEN
jgi:hypothetical protein